MKKICLLLVTILFLGLFASCRMNFEPEDILGYWVNVENEDEYFSIEILENIYMDSRTAVYEPVNAYFFYKIGDEEIDGSWALVNSEELVLNVRRNYNPVTDSDRTNYTETLKVKFKGKNLVVTRNNKSIEYKKIDEPKYD
ncbi:MAG: hypothetical protein MJ174_11105 [Treponema sp.]|nr:hypothetical protein [Treponema sp.]